MGQAERRAAIEATWGGDLRELGATVLFSLANPTLFETRQQGNLLFTDCYDRHDDLTRRTIGVFGWLLSTRCNSSWTHLLMLDDDCYVVADRLASLPWRANHVTGRNNGGYMAGGPGVILSQYAIKELLYYMRRDDCVIGAILGSFTKISCLNLKDEFSHPWREAPWPDKGNSVVFQHYVRTPEEMYKIREALK